MPRSFRDVPTCEHETFAEDVAWELEHLQGVGIRRMICIDLTKPEFGIPVMRVIAPGLEGCDEVVDYTPGARALALRREMT